MASPPKDHWKLPLPLAASTWPSCVTTGGAGRSWTTTAIVFEGSELQPAALVSTIWYSPDALTVNSLPSAFGIAKPSTYHCTVLVLPSWASVTLLPAQRLMGPSAVTEGTEPTIGSSSTVWLTACMHPAALVTSKV